MFQRAKWISHNLGDRAQAAAEFQGASFGSNPLLSTEPRAVLRSTYSMLRQERQLLTFTTAYLYDCSPLRLLTFTARNRKGFLFWWLRLRELSTWRVESLVVVLQTFSHFSITFQKFNFIECLSQYLRHSTLYGLSQAPSHFHTPILTPML